MSHLELVALVVRDYDAAIRFFVEVLQFELVEDTPSRTKDGRPKRWVVIRPEGGQTAFCSRVPTAMNKQALWASSSPVALECSCASTILIRPTSEWSPPVCGSSRRLAMSHTADLPCFSILRETAGTSWDDARESFNLGTGGRMFQGDRDRRCHRQTD